MRAPVLPVGRPLRFIPPGAMVEVTTRTLQGRLLLRPCAELTEILLGILGRALSLYPVVLHAFVFASNHAHLLLTTPDALFLARFMGFVNSNIAREAGRLYAWRERFWGRRYRAVVVLGDDAVLTRLRYLLAHGCKEGLVKRPADWPGASSLPALVDGHRLQGFWFNRTAEYRARRRGQRPGRYEHATPYDVPLTPLPCWASLSADERRLLCTEMVQRIEAETAARGPEAGPKAPGREYVCRQDPHEQPRRVSKSPAPLCHASNRDDRRGFRAAYGAFVAAFRRAAEHLRAGLPDPGFPLWSFPPALPFVALPEALPP